MSLSSVDAGSVHNETHLSAFVLYSCIFVLQQHVLHSAWVLANRTSGEKRFFGARFLCRRYSPVTVIARNIDMLSKGQNIVKSDHPFDKYD